MLAGATTRGGNYDSCISGLQGSPAAWVQLFVVLYEFTQQVQLASQADGGCGNPPVMRRPGQ